MKVCFKCKESKSLDLFFRHKQTSDGYHSWCKSCCNAGNERSREKLNSTIEGRARVFLQNARKSAKKRGHVFDLEVKDIVDFWAQQDEICAYSGRKMTLVAGKINTVSIERIDSNSGYTKENTILVCQAVNRMKSDFSFSEFYDLCRDVSIFLGDEKLTLSVGAFK